MVTRRRSAVVGVLGGVVLAGCSSPIVGEWVSDLRLGNGEVNSLTANDDLRGVATIFATPADDHAAWARFEFDLAWSESGEGFQVQMDCRGAPERSFQMSCMILTPTDGGADRMDCVGERQWASYPFDFARSQ